MKDFLLSFIFLSYIISILSLIPNWNLSNVGENLLSSSIHEYTLIHRISEDNVELKMTRKIIKENNNIYINNSIYMQYNSQTILNTNITFDYVQSFYVINNNFIVCPKGPYHPYNLNTEKYEIPNNFGKMKINDWDLKCFKLNDNFLLIFYLINGNKNFFYRNLYNNQDSGMFLSQNEELYDSKVNNKEYHQSKTGEYGMITLSKKENKLLLKGKAFYLEDQKKDQFDAGQTITLCSTYNYTQGYFSNDTNSFYYITYDNIYDFSSGYVTTYEINIDIDKLDWANVAVNNNKPPFEFIDEVEIEEINFMLYNRFVYYKIRNKNNNNEIYHGIIDIVQNKVVFNTNEEIINFIPYSNTAMLAITSTDAYKICIYKDNGESVEKCDNGYNLDLNGNTCGSITNCPDNKYMLIPNEICIDSCDKIYFIETEGKCGLCKDLYPEEKPYKLINGTECIVDFNETSMEIYNQNLKILRCKSNYKFINNTCVLNCHINCETCDEYSEDVNHQKCHSCEEGFYLEDEENCKDNCSERYGIVEKKCVKCNDDNCEVFVKNSCDCDKCKKGFSKNNENKCLSNNNSDYIIWVLIAIIAIILIVIIICLLKKCFCSKNFNSYYHDDISNELQEKELLE